MNLKSGLIRLWAMASVAWMLFIAALLVYSWWNFGFDDGWRVVALDGKPVHDVRSSTPPAVYAVFLAAAVPLVVLAAGLGVAWVVRGFRRPKDRTPSPSA